MVRLRPAFLKAASRRDMLARLLSNLKGVYLNAHDDDRAISAVERLLLIRPDAIGERKTLGLLLARRGRNTEALHHLREYLESLPESSRDSRRITALIERIRSGESLDAEDIPSEDVE